MVIKTFDDGSKARPFGHCLIAGVDKAPQRMSKKKITKRLRVKPFMQYINYNHIMPTRYQIPAEIDAKTIVTDQQMDTSDGRVEAKKMFKKMLQEKFKTPPSDKSGKASKDMLYLRSKLRF